MGANKLLIAAFSVSSLEGKVYWWEIHKTPINILQFVMNIVQLGSPLDITICKSTKPIFIYAFILSNNILNISWHQAVWMKGREVGHQNFIILHSRTFCLSYQVLKIPSHCWFPLTIHFIQLQNNLPKWEHTIPKFIVLWRCAPSHICCICWSPIHLNERIQSYLTWNPGNIRGTQVGQPDLFAA